MSGPAVVVEDLWKSFRLYEEKNQYLKAAVLERRRSRYKEFWALPERGSVSHTGRLSALLELGAGFHMELSGRENVYLNGAILGFTKRDLDRRFDDIVEFAGLGSTTCRSRSPTSPSTGDSRTRSPAPAASVDQSEP